MKIKIPHNLAEIIIVFLIFLFNNETLSNNYCQFIDQPVRLVAVIVLLFGLYRLAKGRLSICKYAMFALVFLTLFVIVGIIFDQNYTNGYFLTWMSLVVGFIVSISIDYESFSNIYSRVITFFAVCSLIGTYVIQYITPWLLSFFGTITNSAGVSFYNLGLCYIIRSSTNYRNLGIFREPGVYAIFLCFAIAMLLSGLLREKDKVNRKKITIRLIILSATVLTTFSTTGYIAYTLILIFYFMFQKGTDSKSKKYGGILIVFVALFALFLFSTDNDTILNPFLKLSSGTKEYSSFLYRMETIVNGIRLITKNPFGYGLMKGQNLLQLSSTLRFHNTNTWVSFALYFGVGYLVICFWGLWKYCKNNMTNGWLIFSIIILLSGEVIIYNPMMYAFVMYGFIKSYTRLEGKPHENCSN